MNSFFIINNEKNDFFNFTSDYWSFYSMLKRV